MLLHSACRFGKVPVVDFLLSNGADIGAVTRKEKQMPIHIAAASRHISILDLLICKGGLMEAKDKNGWTTLYHACHSGNAGILEYLIDKGANIKAENFYNQGAVHIAALAGHTHIVKILDEHHCCIDGRDINGWTPLHVSCRRGFYDLAIYLINRGVSINAETNLKERPLHLAQNNGHSLIVDILINREFLKSEPYEEVVPSLDNFKKLEFLGQGSFGKVYKCFDECKKIEFALKEVQINNIKEINALENEINIYIKLNGHNRTVRYFGNKITVSEMIIFMEYMPGGSLESKLDKEGPFATNLISKYTKQILQGLDFLHQNEIIHRDIKPPNILLSYDDNVKLCDFGISKRLQTQTSNIDINGDKKRQVTAQSLMGTSDYMAPEILLGKKYDVLVDVYSLGVTVIEMLTGKRLNCDSFPLRAAYRLLNNGKLDYEVPLNTPPSLRLFIEQMVEFDPNDRADVSTLLGSDFISSQ